MTEMLALLIFLATCVASVWLVAKKYGRTQEELKNTKEDKENEENQNSLVSTYINMSSQQLLDRMHEKRKAAEERMRSKDRLDR